ncbi:hypothetical protein [Clostridium lundense]|uniref:hypothetical protein n=1 Tax=Clostridium lundense TaxID=319475 RepID=UPI000483F114|nr:hypothetical protein [Clostridium lundense]
MADELKDVRQAATCNTITVEPCATCSKTTLSAINLENFLQITVTATVNNVCANKALVIGAVLCEQLGDVSNIISTQIFTRPAGTGTGCGSVTHDFVFVIPDTCRTDNRIFRATAVANYILNNTNCVCPCTSA